MKGKHTKCPVIICQNRSIIRAVYPNGTYAWTRTYVLKRPENTLFHVHIVVASSPKTT